jgi:hypothetical protein
MAAKAAQRAEKPVPIGELIDELWAVREDMRALEKQKNDLEIEYDALEDKIKHALDSEKLKQGRGSRATASIVVSEVPHLEDWDQFIFYVRKTGNFQLFERRIAVKAWREILAKTKRPPRGTTVFTKRKLNLATI